jgi:KDO2-lipid IV(A) lauroyltransferase
LSPEAPSDWTGECLAAAGLDAKASVPLRRRLRAAALGGLAGAAAHLPSAAVLPFLRAASSQARRGRLGERARRNLELALGSELDSAAREQLLQRCFAHGARQASEWLRLARGAAPESIQGAWIEHAVLFDDSIEHLEKIQADGRGAILVTAHLGNWELLAAAVRRRGVRGAVVGRVNRQQRSSAWLPRLRAGYGVPTLPQDSSPRGLLRVLQTGGVIGMLCDLEVRRLDGEHLPFFGVPALTMSAPAALARAAKLPLLPVRCVLPVGAGPQDSYRLQFEEPIRAPARGSGEQGTRATLTQLLAVYERWIRESPEQWAWHQHRWRTQPGSYEALPMAERRRIDIAKLKG